LLILSMWRDGAQGSYGLSAVSITRAETGMSYQDIANRLARRETIILDGGTGTDIQRRGAPMSTETWCADVNSTHPHIVQQVHADYIAAGADIITANTFATSALAFNYRKRDDDMIALDQAAVAAAKAAAKGTTVAIAGSVSTQRPVIPGTDRTDLNFNWSRAEAVALFQRKLDNLKDCGVDLLMMEMMRDCDYSLWACETAVSAGLPVWIGLSVERRGDGVLVGFGRQDQKLDEFAPALAAVKPDVMSIMHTSPNDTGEAIAILKQHWSGPIGTYPESGYFKSPDWVFGDITPDELLEHSLQWRAAGATVFGGCCGIGPHHISLLSREFKK
jgi:S-methylmethionine-dependent homocysteine/selenocysteine methylase